MKLGNRALASLFVVTAFVGAALLFASEPMIGKLLLPLFGGSSGVWNTCMVFFQLALLGGYVYAHWSIRRFGVSRQPRWHVILLLVPFVVLPIALPAWASHATTQLPALRILAILLVTVGPPFFVLSTSGPLLQRWFAETSHPNAAQPYFLYAASNVGSFMALLAYPLLIEPTLSLDAQSIVWAAGYGLFVMLTVMCLFVVRHYRRPIAKLKIAKPSAITGLQKSQWLVLAFLPSSLMLGVTSHITSDVAAVPLLWVLPLAVYLLTFVIAFAVRSPLVWAHRVSPLAAAGLFGAFLWLVLPLNISRLLIAIYYILLFGLIALVSHSRLASRCPPAAQLTEFYLWVAVGGMLGGVFNSLIAPLIFHDVYEFPLMLLLSVLLLVEYRQLRRPGRRNIILSILPMLLVIALVICLAVLKSQTLLWSALLLSFLGAFYLYRWRPLAYGLGMMPLLVVPIVVMANQPLLTRVRTFYGVIKVKQEAGKHIMIHGVTEHGSQYINPAKARQPISYYNPKGPLSEAITACRQVDYCRHVGVIGLGTGTIATYGRTGDDITFYELDPAVYAIARDPRYFTFLRDSQAKVDTIIGDGRLNLQQSTSQYDLIVIDAFSSDAIPTHLLTREALELYRAHLSPHGLLVFHISNRYLRLEPILNNLARGQGLQARVRYDPGQGNDDTHIRSRWAVFFQHPQDVSSLEKIAGWEPLKGRTSRPWSDSYSNILDALRD